MLRVETSGKSVEEAVAKALQQLGLDQAQVDVEVVSEGRGGIFGVGAQQARVIVTPRPGVVVTGFRPAAADEADDYDDEADEAFEDDDDAFDEDEEELDDDDDEFDEDEDEADAPLVAPRAPVAAPPPASQFRRGPPNRQPPRGPVPAQPRAPRPPRTRPPADPNDPVAVAVEILEEMLDRLGIDAEVSPRPPQTEGDGSVAAVLDVRGEELGMLIGRRGETIGSLQYLVNLILNRKISEHTSVGVDVEGYRRRREESLRNLAQRVAERVTANGQSITLEPMPPNERRIVHITLADHPDVLTVSIGEGEARKVAITPRR